MANAIVTVASISTNSIWFKVQVKGTNVSKNMEWTPTFSDDTATMQTALINAVISFALAQLGITVVADDVIVVGAPTKLS